MKDKKSIIIFYSKGIYDTNALQLADAIRTTAGNECHVIAIGDDKYTNFGRGRIARGSYIFSVRNARWMYGAYSTMTAKTSAPDKALKNIKADPTERTGYNKFAYEMTCRYHKIKNILRRFEPDIVLCYTPTVLNAAIKANEQLRMYTTKIYACLTDFCLDMRFFNRRCAGYIVQNEDVKKQLVSAGIDDEKTFVTNIISNTLPHYNREVLKVEVGIRNDKPNVLLVGGRYGASVIKSALNSLIHYTDNFNLIVLTGGSETIVNVAKHIVGNNDSVFVVDKVDDIGKLYELCDIVIATPTTCICSEALSYNKMLILLNAVGNVEKGNAKYLTSHNYAFDGSNKDKLVTALSDILLSGDNKLISYSQYIESGYISNLARFILDKAEEIFEEKQIVLAEKNISSEEDAKEEVEIEEVGSDLTDAALDAAYIDEYNDIEEK